MYCMFCENGAHGRCTISYCRCPLSECIRSQSKVLIVLKDVMNPYKSLLGNGQRNQKIVSESPRITFSRRKQTFSQRPKTRR